MSTTAAAHEEPLAKRIKLDVTTASPPESVIEPADSTSQPEPFKRLTEQDCGIHLHLNPHLSRFACLLKELTSDFQVFEVLSSGEVLRLKDFPKAEDLEREREAAKAQKVEAESIIQQQSFDYTTPAAHALQELLGADTFERVKALFSYSDWQGLGANAPIPVITEVIDDRERRTRIHKAIREVFLGSLNSEARDDKKMKISLQLKNQNGRGGSGTGGGRTRGNRGRNAAGSKSGNSGGDRREAWSEAGDYTYFTVYKDGRDTMDVANNISKILRVPTKTLGYSGSKDKRGCTVQRFSAYRMQIHKLANLNGNPALKGTVLGDFTYGKKNLTLGDLEGNKFVLVLRDIQGSTDEQINESFKLIDNRGFINYYGLQRFGSSSTGTHQVGIHVLKGEYERACELILQEHSGAWRETREAKMHWIETKDAQATLDMMPRKCLAEVAMLNHLARQEQQKDWAGAFGSIPRNLRLMYMHAYQSLVWNNAVTQRIARYGLQPVAGDLVLEAGADISREDQDVPNDKVISRARAITKEETNSYTIHDVVLPLPGCDIVYPENEIKDFYADFMRKENLDPFNMVRKTRETTLMGSYRKILSRPIDLKWQVLKYTAEQAKEQLIATNIDELEGRSIALPTEGSHTAVRLEFQLETAAYATMLLREALSSVPYSV